MRIGNGIRLCMEEGRYHNICLENRICFLFHLGVEDILYFVLKCNKLDTERTAMLTAFENCTC